MEFEYRGCTGVIGYRNYYIKDNGRTVIQAICSEKPTEEHVKKCIDMYIKNKKRGKHDSRG